MPSQPTPATHPGLCAILAAVALACLPFPGRGDEKKVEKVTPLRHAHAHNDYEHKRPLLDALEHGFCSVEADVFLVGDRLLVGHERKDLRPERTLETLYLDPLRERAKANGGRVYPGGPAVYLLIDVKTEAGATYAALDKVLARYADQLSVTRHGKFEPGAVTAVVSGNRAPEAMAAQKVRYAGYDGRPADLDKTIPADLMPWISAAWGSLFRWQGEGVMPEMERARLREFVGKAHGHGRLVRFWATPEKPVVWKELRAAGVDLINTDKLAELRRFLLDSEPAAAPR
jgi:Glycerophosphoryl diester phosphodiesterase family